MPCDSHLHLHEITDGYPDIGNLALLFTCTARPSEWNTVRSIDDSRVTKFYGIHPWYADEWCQESENTLRSILSQDPKACIGEIGMDRSRPDIELQKTILLAQLVIAKEFHRPVTIHMNGCEKDVLDCLKGASPGVPVILHSFKSESYVKPFTEQGCHFSVGPRLLSKKKESIARILESIPYDRLLIETDAPYFGRGFRSMGELYSEYSEILSITKDELANRTYSNMESILKTL